MTLTQKILARASERPYVAPGENVWVNTDVLMTHDVCGPGTIGIFKREFGENAKVSLPHPCPGPRPRPTPPACRGLLARCSWKRRAAVGAGRGVATVC